MGGGDPLETCRNIPLDRVAAALGYRKDPDDRARFRREGSVISINGEKFFDHLRGTGGGGAIDLVIHATGCRFPDAPALPRRPRGAGESHRLPGRPAAPAAARAQSSAHGPESATPSSVNAPSRADVLEACHGRGLLYADERLNAVFVCRNAGGNPAGAEIIGTVPQAGTKRFRGMAPGSRKARGGFWLPCDRNPPRVGHPHRERRRRHLRSKPAHRGNPRERRRRRLNRRHRQRRPDLDRRLETEARHLCIRR